MTATAQQVLNVARSQLGTAEKPKGSNRVLYSLWYKLIGAWCGMFVSWVSWRAGASDIIPKFAYTPSGAAWFQARGRYGSTPRVGAVVFFRWPTMGRICHVGFVEEIRSDGAIVTLEGNTDAGGSRTGGMVMRRVRRANIAGYGYPEYAKAVTGKPTTPAKNTAGKIPAPRTNGPSRVQSKATQDAVNVVADGRWGPQTDAAINRVRFALNNQFPSGVKASQQTVGVKQDGKWGKASKAALAQAVAALQTAWGCKPDGAWGPQTDAAWKAARARNYNR